MIADVRVVTERDFRKEEFRDAKPEDYEFRADGTIARKDRWESAVRCIAGALGMGRMKWEISDVLSRFQAMVTPPYREGSTSLGVAFIANERGRQVVMEGWTTEHDDAHADGELVRAALCYQAYALRRASAYAWPWSPGWWKPSEDPVRNLVKAGALIAAEIDRLLRARGLADVPVPEPSAPKPQQLEAAVGVKA